MSIEACSFLRPSLKAKLQDSGILFLSDLLPFFERPEEPPANLADNNDDDGSSSNASGSHNSKHHRKSEAVGLPRQPSSSLAASLPSPSKPQGVFVLRCDNSLEDALTLRLPRLTKEELFDLITSTTAYLHSREKRLAARSPGPRKPPTALNIPGLLPPPPPSPSPPPPSGRLPTERFTVRSLGEIEHEMRAPHRGKPRNRRGPTHATTFCRSLDTLLGAPDLGFPHDPSKRKEGGVEVGKLTELSGPPGVGKTQLLLQLAVSCAMPVELGGLDGSCLFIDTEGSFVYERFYEIALAAVVLVKDLERRRRQSSPAAVGGDDNGKGPARRSPAKEAISSPSTVKSPASTPLARVATRFTLASILSRVHYVRVADTASFMAVLYSVPTWVAQRKAQADAGAADSAREGFSLKMILVDSIAAPFRVAAGGASWPTSGEGAQSSSSVGAPSFLRQRSRLLLTCGERLASYAAAFNLAVVASNQVTSKTARCPTGNDKAVPVKRRRLDGGGEAEVAREGEGEEEEEEEGGDCSTVADQDARHGGSAMAGDRSFTYLVPALGDTWAMHTSTRVLLSYHHYVLPYYLSDSSGDEFGERRRSLMLDRSLCAEDVVMTRRQQRRTTEGDPSSAQQHRVARLIKHDCNPRGECCFAISRKGIRDVAH